MTERYDEKAIRTEITDKIRNFVREDPANRLTLDGLPIFDEPLVGFASGSDALFGELKTVIGPFHLTPFELMQQAAALRGLPTPPEGSVGVVSFVLPMHEETVKANASMSDRPSRRWVHGKHHGEEVRKNLVGHMLSFLKNKGFFCVCPADEADFSKIMIDPAVGLCSTWSERHVAYAAGLGTFGLSDGLITEAGVAQAVGSIVVGMDFSSPSRQTDIHAACLYHRSRKCKACAKRCPAGAISEQGHDKNKCAVFAFSHIPFNKEEYGIETYGCGLCLTGVPCSSRNPVKRDKTSPIE